MAPDGRAVEATRHAVPGRWRVGGSAGRSASGRPQLALPTLLAATVAACVVAGCSRGSSALLVTVDPATRRQVMTGWEATAQAGQEDSIYERYRDTVLAVAVDDLGINRLRLEIRAGAERNTDAYGDLRAGRLTERQWRCLRYTVVNDDADPRTINWSGFQFAELDLWVERVLLPMRQRLAARGERLSVNLNYVAFIGQCGRPIAYPHADPEEYAEFVLATVLHLRQKYGFVPDTWEVILEPEHNTHWTGRRIGEAVAAAAARLREAGIVMRFVAPSTTGVPAAATYIDEMAAVPGALAGVAEFAYHRYRGPSIAALRAVADRGARYGVPTAMLEHIGSGVEDLEDDLRFGNVSAWQQFTLTYPSDSSGPAKGGHYIAVRRDSAGGLQVALAPRSRFLRQYFRYIRMGATRVEATSDRRRTHPVAFVHPDGRWVVVVRTRSATDVSIAGLPAGPYAATWTTADTAGPIAVRADPGGLLHTAIPAAGVLTVYTDTTRSR